MECQSQITAALKELTRITGIELNLAIHSPEDEEQALNQIRCLITAYKEKYNKTQFLLSAPESCIYPLMKNGFSIFWTFLGDWMKQLQKY